ncbi:MAG: thioesterase family protein [Proteobacteria bacterium]|nr:thioesterase family protein [Pseudomonadota bacterium]
MTSHQHLIHRSASAQKVIEQAICHSFEQMAFHAYLGLKVKKCCSKEAQIEVAMRPELIGTAVHERLHGGVIATILDAAGGFAICNALVEKFCDETLEQLAARFARVGTVDMRVDYLRQGVGKLFTASGKIIRLGGRIATTQMTLENEDGDMIASGTASYVVS